MAVDTRAGAYMEHGPAKDRHGTGETVCVLCGQIWPCQVAEWEVEGKRLRTQVARLEGEKAALAAALEYLKLFRAGLHGLSGKQQVDAVCVQEALDHGLGLAALSDTGEGKPSMKDTMRQSLAEHGFSEEEAIRLTTRRCCKGEESHED